MNTVTFTDIDPASVESTVLTAYETIAQTTLYPGDPVRLFLEGLAYVLALQNNVINLAGLQNLLAHAQGGHLDELAFMVGTKRLGTAASRCVQRFALAAPLTFDVPIPAGTRVTTADRVAVFATVGPCSITAGQTETQTPVVAQEVGAALNGLVSGQINRLMDPVAYIVRTENISPTTFGADTESDEGLRARAQLAPESYTCAGPVGSYRYHALQAHQDIAEVSVWSPVPGTVDIRPILRGGELPSEDLLALVRARVNADNVRPLTDTVIVAAPELVAYAIRVSWALITTDEARSATVTALVTEAVERYRLWQRSAPGRDINPTKLISLMEQAGARRVTVTEPVFQPLQPRQIARESSVHVAFLGLEAD